MIQLHDCELTGADRDVPADSATEPRDGVANSEIAIAQHAPKVSHSSQALRIAATPDAAVDQRNDKLPALHAPCASIAQQAAAAGVAAASARSAAAAGIAVNARAQSASNAALRSLATQPANLPHHDLHSTWSAAAAPLPLALARAEPSANITGLRAPAAAEASTAADALVDTPGDQSNARAAPRAVSRQAGAANVVPGSPRAAHRACTTTVSAVPTAGNAGKSAGTVAQAEPLHATQELAAPLSARARRNADTRFAAADEMYAAGGAAAPQRHDDAAGVALAVHDALTAPHPPSPRDDIAPLVRAPAAFSSRKGVAVDGLSTAGRAALAIDPRDVTLNAADSQRTLQNADVRPAADAQAASAHVVRGATVQPAAVAQNVAALDKTQSRAAPLPGPVAQNRGAYAAVRLESAPPAGAHAEDTAASPGAAPQLATTHAPAWPCAQGQNATVAKEDVAHLAVVSPLGAAAQHALADNVAPLSFAAAHIPELHHQPARQAQPAGDAGAAALQLAADPEEAAANMAGAPAAAAAGGAMLVRTDAADAVAAALQLAADPEEVAANMAGAGDAADAGGAMIVRTGAAGHAGADAAIGVHVFDKPQTQDAVARPAAAPVAATHGFRGSEQIAQLRDCMLGSADGRVRVNMRTKQGAPVWECIFLETDPRISGGAARAWTGFSVTDEGTVQTLRQLHCNWKHQMRFVRKENTSSGVLMDVEKKEGPQHLTVASLRLDARKVAANTLAQAHDFVDMEDLLEHRDEFVSFHAWCDKNRLDAQDGE